MKGVLNVLGKDRNDISDPSNLVIATSSTALADLEPDIYRVLSILAAILEKGR